MADRNGRGVFFDLDGVVLDSIGAIWRTTREVLFAVGVPEARLPDVECFLTTFAMPCASFYRAYGVTSSPAELDDLFFRIIPCYEEVVEPYWGIRPTVERLRTFGFRTAIVSSGRPERIEAKLSKFDLRGLFDAVYAGAAIKTESLRAASADFGLPPERACFVGDLSSDMRDARAAGILPIGFAADYPFMPPVLVTAGAVAWVHELEDLPSVITGLLSQC
ncbi:MAG: HAD family hydrolase [Candidatus Vogelbacteria bacterium]|nr:HAD family hydrolase [Candidatus Vogelbacteria bacterium]